MRVFLEFNACEALAAGAMVPAEIDQVLAAIVIVKERRIEAGAVEVNGVRPLAIDGRACHQVVVGIAERGTGGGALGGAAVALYVGIDEPEQTVGVGEAGCPDAAGIRVAQHVELAGTGERAGEQTPVDQIAGN